MTWRAWSFPVAALLLCLVLSVEVKAQSQPGVSVPLSVLLGNEYGAASKMSGANVTANQFGVDVSRAYDQAIKDARGRAWSVPLKAKASLPKAAFAAGLAARCMAAPVACGAVQLAPILAPIAYDAASGLMAQPRSLSYVFVNSSSAYHTPLTRTISESVCKQLYPLSTMKNVRLMNVEEPWSGNTLYDRGTCWYDDVASPCSVASPCVRGGANLYQCNGSGTAASQAAACNKTGEPAGDPLLQTTQDPRTEAELAAEIAKVGKWPHQDTSFAATFGAAVTAGATWPINTSDSGKVEANGAMPAAATSTSTTTGPNGTTTTTTTSQPAVQAEGTTAGDAKAKVTVTTTTVVTSPEGTTTTESEETPEANVSPGSNPLAVSPEITVEIPEVTFTDTPLPEVPELYEQKFPDGFAGVWQTRYAEIQGTAFVSGISDMFAGFPQSGGCPSFAMNLNFGQFANYGEADLSPPCWIWDVVRVVLLLTALFVARRIIFGG